MHMANALNRERILRTAPSPDGPGRVVLVEALLTEDEIESIQCILSALARRQHPRGEYIYKARYYARETLFMHLNQMSLNDRLSHIEEFHRDRRGRSRSPRTIAQLTSESLETPEPSPGAYTRGEERSDESEPEPKAFVSSLSLADGTSQHKSGAFSPLSPSHGRTT